MRKNWQTKCQTHLNREKKQPTKKVNVFLWDWSNEDPRQLVCTKVSNYSEGEWILSMYSKSHLVYDSYSNVWDACKYFRVADNYSDDDEPMSAPVVSLIGLQTIILLMMRPCLALPLVPLCLTH